jgi:FkbM family methyltransferase
MVFVKYYSQFGEDKILAELFQSTVEGSCVEVGANNGVDDSTTLFFEELGWKCILVEPNPDLCKEIRRKRRSTLFECAISSKRGEAVLYVAGGADRSHGMSTISDSQEDHDRIKSYGFDCVPVKVKVRTLDEILEETGIDCDIDFMSIDVEGLELEVLKGLSIEKWKPKIILVEDNSNFENKDVRNYLKQHEYVRFDRTGVNDWFTHSSNRQFMSLKGKFRIILIYTDTKINQFIRIIKNILKIMPIIIKLRKALKKPRLR